jgi:hypothetical protein
MFYVVLLLFAIAVADVILLVMTFWKVIEMSKTAKFLNNSGFLAERERFS